MNLEYDEGLHLRRPWLRLLAVLAVFGSCGAAVAVLGAETSGSSFESRFRSPPPESRIIKIVHGWPDAPEAQDALIRNLSTQGFGGVVCNVSFADYLRSEAKWGAFKRAVSTARDAGFSMWLYDEKGYPSGTAGGQTMRDHPEWEARGLLVSDADTEGAEVKLDLPPGRPVMLAAFPVRDGVFVLEKKKDVSAFARDGKLSWTPPPGRWRVLAVTEDKLYEGTHASMSLSDHIPYPNLLDREPTARFLQLTHGGYAEHLGNDLGQYFVATFTDEPSLMSLFLRPMPYRVLPWSATFPVEFKKRRGYALDPLVPALIGDAGPAGRRARYDYWQTVGELVSENFFGQIQDWCSAHHVLSGGHLLMEENLAAHVPLYGDFFRCLRRLDAPSIDCLTSVPEQVPWLIARLAGSAAELENKSVTMCETSDHSQRYRPAGDKRPIRNVTEEEIRGTCNRLAAGGIDTITSYYSFAGLSEDAVRRLNEWVGRCCTSLKGGHHVTDLAVLYPIESVWPRFTPARHLANDSAAALEIEHTFSDVSDSLFAAGRDFEFVDARTLATAKVTQGALLHGDLRWRVVVLPGADTLPLAAWENLLRFAEAGGVVIAIANFPANSERDFPSARVQAIATELFGPGTGNIRTAGNREGGGGIFLPAGSTTLVPRILDRILEPDVRIAETPSPVRVTHRRIEEREVYFIVNDSKSTWSGNLKFASKGAGEQWDLATGGMKPLRGQEPVSLTLEPYGAVIFRFNQAVQPRRVPLDSHATLRQELRETPMVPPLVSRGEFVREELTPVNSAPNQPQHAWKVVGNLTKGQVDTFLFVRFPYAQPLDLRGVDSLVIETSVPAGQRTPNQLLVMLHEKDGADYLATTGRMLGVPGSSLSWVPLARFQLAGWSEDKNSRLDLDNISEVRIGWGGYHGSEGEKVEFTLSLPQTATLR